MTVEQTELSKYKKIFTAITSGLILFSVGTYILATIYWIFDLSLGIFSVLVDNYFPQDILYGLGLIPFDTIDWTQQDYNLFVFFSVGSLAGIFILTFLASYIGKFLAPTLSRIIIKIHSFVRRSTILVQDSSQKSLVITHTNVDTLYNLLIKSFPIMFATYGISLAITPYLGSIMHLDDEYYALLLSIYVCAIALFIIIPLYYAMWLLDESAIRAMIPGAREEYSLGTWTSNLISGYTGFMVIITLVRLLFDWSANFGEFFRDYWGFIILPLSLYSIPVLFATFFFQRQKNIQITVPIKYSSQFLLQPQPQLQQKDNSL